MDAMSVLTTPAILQNGWLSLTQLMNLIHQLQMNWEKMVSEATSHCAPSLATG
jgi:hypothetical protein